MTLTFLDLYNECAGQPWSMYDNDADSIEGFESALKGSINLAISYLWDYQDWSFKRYTKIIKSKAGRKAYTKPNGNLYKKIVNKETKYSIKIDGENLDYLSDYEYLDEEEGQPTGFYIKGETLYLYPTPDKVYQVEIEYSLMPYGLNTANENIYELSEETDYINIPEKYESRFKNCVINLAMLYAIDDESDENYSGYKKRYEDALSVLMKNCFDKSIDKRIVW